MRVCSYYWDYEIDNCIVRMSNSQYLYGYEYLGASARLVITPLTVCDVLVVERLDYSELNEIQP